MRFEYPGKVKERSGHKILPFPLLINRDNSNFLPYSPAQARRTGMVKCFKCARDANARRGNLETFAE